jgi:hypothetical protein
VATKPTSRRSGLLLSIALCAPFLTACDPGWFVLARNDSSNDVRLQITSASQTKVFQLPQGFLGILDGGIGTTVEATADVIDNGCGVLASVALTGATVLVTIEEDGSVRASPTEGLDNVGDVWAQEIRGECGSTRSDRK